MIKVDIAPFLANFPNANATFFHPKNSVVASISPHTPCDFLLIKLCTPEAIEDLIFFPHWEEDR